MGVVTAVMVAGIVVAAMAMRILAVTMAAGTLVAPLFPFVRVDMLSPGRA